MMSYKGFGAGEIAYDDDAGILHGQVAGTRDIITFQGRNAAELRTAFRESIDDYLDFCRVKGRKPDKPYSGKFVARVPPSLHRALSAAAQRSGKSLNAWLAEKLESALGSEPVGTLKDSETKRSHRKSRSVAKSSLKSKRDFTGKESLKRGGNEVRPKSATRRGGASSPTSA